MYNAISILIKSGFAVSRVDFPKGRRNTYAMRMVSIRYTLAAVFYFLIVCNPVAAQKDFTQYVDPNIGTAHCRWFHYTPGAQPFGMAKPAPSTNGSYGNVQG